MPQSVTLLQEKLMRPQLSSQAVKPQSLMLRSSRLQSLIPQSLTLFLAVTLIALGLLCTTNSPAFAQSAKPGSNGSQHSTRPTAAAAPGDVARGKYLVEGVAMCGQCHTPRDGNGNPDRTRWLQGAPIVWLSPDHDPNWPLSAPRIGGTPPANDEDMVKLLTTGVWTTGNRLRLPMPQFRMDRSDAEAVVAYLKSLTKQE
jgi:mono/diheme cytochrome c family protein